MSKKEWRFRTRAVHAGEQPDSVTGAAAPSIVPSTSFVTHEGDTGFTIEESLETAPFLYAREGNPNVRQLEVKLASLDGGETAVAFGSGMAAGVAMFWHFLKPGDHLVASDVCYVGVAEYMRKTLPRFGVEVTPVDLSDLDLLRAAFRPNTKMVFAETPANPILRLTDIRAVAEIAHERGVRLVVDSTFATPAVTLPLQLGADVVAHSLTKYLNGHGDAMGGVVIGSRADLKGLREEGVAHGGAILSPFSAWLILRGLVTLPIRMRAHSENAMQVARFLESHPAVSRVIYPGLASHPQHELARRQMQHPSGMLAFQTPDGPATARKFAKKLEVFHYTVSLGHHKSLIFYISTSELQSHSFQLDPQALARYRSFAGDGVFRVSVGLEDPEDLCADLAQALA